MVALLLATIAVIFAIAFLPVAYRAIRVVPEYNRLVVFRLGRSIGHKGPGLVWLWPIVDRAVAVDLREQGPGAAASDHHQRTTPPSISTSSSTRGSRDSAAPLRAGSDEPPAFGRAD